MSNSWKVDDFDSEVFRFKVARIQNLDPKNVKNLIRDLIKNKVKYATFRISSKDFVTIHILEREGFKLIDGLMSLSLNLDSVNPKIDSAIREAKDSDIANLKKLTTNLYSGTRITNDPLTHAHANNYYKMWIENSVKGKAADSVLLWSGGEILGYVTLQKKSKEGQIPLIGVSTRARGKGIASSLLNAALAKFKKWGIKTVNIDTQMDNISALRAYQKVGFKIIGACLTFRWLS